MYLSAGKIGGAKPQPAWRRELARLGNDELLARLGRYVRERRQVTAQLLAQLGEVDARKLYLQQATSSMFAYCTQRLGMSEPTAYKFIRVARLARQVPEVLEYVAAGRLSSSGLKLLAPHAGADNASELFAAAAGRSTRDIARLVAEWFPQPDVPSEIRKWPERRRSAAAPSPDASGAAAAAQASQLAVPSPGAGTPPQAPPPAAAGAGAEATAGPSTAGPSTAGPSTAGPSTAGPSTAGPATGACPAAGLGAPPVGPPPSTWRRPVLAPLGRERYKVQFTASRSLHDKLRQAQDLLRHQVPDGDLATICERALDLLLAQLLERKFGVRKRATRADAERKSSGRQPTERQRAAGGAAERKSSGRQPTERQRAAGRAAERKRAARKTTKRRAAERLGPKRKRPARSHGQRKTAAPKAAKRQAAKRPVDGRRGPGPPGVRRAGMPSDSCEATDPGPAGPGRSGVRRAGGRAAAMSTRAPRAQSAGRGSGRGPPRSRHIPASVRRAVFERDGMQCAFVDAQGRRCTETGRLEFHHRKPFARGGESTADNIELRCQAHNRLAAEQDFGAEHVEQRIRSKQAQRRGRAA